MQEMFLVVEPLFVQSKVSVVLGIKLNYGYKDLCFSFKIITSLTNATCLEKRNNSFYQQQLFLSNVQENTLRDDRNISILIPKRYRY